MEHNVTRKGRYKVENYSEHNTVEEAIQAATNKSIELGRIVSITPPSYEVVVMGIGECIAQNLGENTGSSGGNIAATPTSSYVYAALPLTITQPQSNLTTGINARSYYYRTYPGIAWNPPISVLGGSWPYTYSISTNAPGLTIGQNYGDPNYGRLYWSNPIEGSYSVSVGVMDTAGTSVTRTWTLTVTKLNTLFINQATGTTVWDGSGLATGAIDAPFKSMHDWWLNGFNDSTYSGYHVYYYSGTYRTSWDWDTVNGGIDGQCRMRDKPNVHIVIPGETVTINVSDYSATDPEFKGGSFFIGDGVGLSDYYWRGFVVEGVGHATNQYRNKMCFLTGSGGRFVFDQNTFRNQNAPGGASTNASYLWTQREATYHDYISFHDNVIEGLNSIQFTELYKTRYLVAEGNTIQNGVGGSTQRFVYAKESTDYVSIRNNVNDNTDCVLLLVGSTPTQIPYDNIEVCWNNCKVPTSTQHHVKLGGTDSGIINDIWMYRNTFTGGQIQHGHGPGTISGDVNGGSVTYKDNVRQYATGTNGIETIGTFNLTISGTETDIVGTSGIVDGATNLLTGLYRADYLGTKGHEVA